MTYDGGRVSATFEDGSKASGNMLVGCDGANSRVRELLLGEKAKLTDIPVMMFNFTQSYTAEQALHVRSLHPMTKFAVYEGTGEIFFISSKLDSASQPEILPLTTGIQSRMFRTLINPRHGSSRSSNSVWMTAFPKKRIQMSGVFALSKNGPQSGWSRFDQQAYGSKMILSFPRTRSDIGLTP